MGSDSCEQNKKLTGDIDALLALQGVNWLLRKAVGLATVTLVVKQYTDDNGVVQIDIESFATGGIKGTSERHPMDGQTYPHNDYVFGSMKAVNKWIKLSDLKDDDEDDKFLKTGWSKDIIDAGEVVYNEVEAEAGWTARGTWGFEMIDGERRHTRHGILKKGDKTIRRTQVFDYAGILPN